MLYSSVRTLEEKRSSNIMYDTNLHYLADYSGHGGQAPARDGDEDDGMNETILPVDFQQAGQMEDDELHMIMVRPLPVGCRLTALFDSCHSGTGESLMAYRKYL
jgi:hypothetical protein